MSHVVCTCMQAEKHTKDEMVVIYWVINVLVSKVCVLLSMFNTIYFFDYININTVCKVCGTSKT